MGTPFNAQNATAVIPATDGQLSYIASLLRDRNWQNSGQTKHIERAAALNLVIGWALDGCDLDQVVELMTAETDGERINQVLAKMIGQAESGREYVWAPLTKQGASKLIDWLGSLQFQSGSSEVEESNVAAAKRSVIEQRSAGVPSADVVPAGRYAIETEDGAVNALAFYKVDRPTEGRWAGRVFVKLMQSDDEQRLSWATTKSVLAKIAAVGAEVASARYGHEIGECGICGRTLTNDESRARGIGPKCAAKAGW